ncbi:MAG: DNA polymerase IV [Candidatus Odyssella sp.]|nr:DNA polymerase IV [Candidatus Odyssella sp.]
MTALCRDCFALAADGAKRCAACGSPRRIAHPELAELGIAHIDCDAFYASVEKRDAPELRDRPVIVGGGRRGVVSAACYMARRYGVRSAMPMFKALKLCPDAAVVRPNMRKYAEVGAAVRERMLSVTPSVEPLSIDEAFLDLRGTERLHKAPPAATLARLARRIEDDLGITVSIGLSYCKFLAKVASDLDKPRGFAVIGRAEAKTFLAGQPVRLIWGVGGKFAERLKADGITHIAQLQALDERTLVGRYGVIGSRLYHFARGEDERTVEPEHEAKSVSAETTFDADIRDFASLRRELWPLCEKVSARMKAAGLEGRGVTLKLKTAGFKLLTRAAQLDHPTQLADTLFRAAEPLLKKEAGGTPYRLIGIGLSHLGPAAGDQPDLFEPTGNKRARVERAMDAVREKLGRNAIATGRGIKS